MHIFKETLTSNLSGIVYIYWFKEEQCFIVSKIMEKIFIKSIREKSANSELDTNIFFTDSSKEFSGLINDVLKAEVQKSLFSNQIL